MDSNFKSQFQSIDHLIQQTASKTSSTIEFTASVIAHQFQELSAFISCPQHSRFTLHGIGNLEFREDLLYAKLHQLFRARKLSEKYKALAKKTIITTRKAYSLAKSNQRASLINKRKTWKLQKEWAIAQKNK